MVVHGLEIPIGEDDARDPTGKFIARGEIFLVRFDLVKF